MKPEIPNNVNHAIRDTQKPIHAIRDIQQL